MVERFKARFLFNGQSFEFELHGRQVELGRAGKVWYSWMHIGQLRGGDCQNYRACVGVWWALLSSAGLSNQPRGRSQNELKQIAIDERWFVLAELYPFVCASKAQQSEVADAIPSRQVSGNRRSRRPNGEEDPLDLEEYVLDAAEMSRLKSIVARRDVQAIRDEIRQLLVGEPLSDEEKPELQEKFESWLEEGVNALHCGGRAELRRYLAEDLLLSLKRIRKRGGQPHLRKFINLVIYNAKLGFYLCYTNAWSSLIPWLRAHRGLDPLSERWLRLWHYQNPREREVDVFYGQILALHPISGRLMSQAHHQVALGAYLMSEDRTCDFENPAYWDLVLSILIACHEYKHLHERYNEQLRGTQTVRAAAITAITRDDAPASRTLAIEEYATRVQPACPSCGNSMAYHRHTEPSEAKQTIRIRYRCKPCRRSRSLVVPVSGFHEGEQE